MYAVIFKAKTRKLDDNYFKMAKRMRELAINEYGCLEFTAVTEDSNEIAISYWESMEQIKLWKQNSEHLVAQKLGIEKWYEDYAVEIVEIVSKNGMMYIHIPITWKNPEVDRVELFLRLLESLEKENKKVLIHCIMNYRASVFMHLNPLKNPPKTKN